MWDGVPSSAAIKVDEVLISSIAEERLSRKKNEYLYPAQASLITGTTLVIDGGHTVGII